MRPLLERLEDRLTPSPLFTVTDNSDNAGDTGSLRYALTNAAKLSISTIDFAATFTGGTPRTISLTGGLTIATDVTIQNDQGAGPVTIDGGGKFTVFTVNGGVTAALSGLTITNGNGSDVGGGGVFNLGTLTISNSTFSGNVAVGDGGGVYNNHGALTVNDSTFSGNSTQSGGGGGIGDYGGTLTVRDSTFSGNIGGGGGGGVNESGGITTLLGDVLVGNTDGDKLSDDLAGDAVDPSSSYNLVGADLSGSGGTGSLSAGQGNQVNVTVLQAGLAPLGNYGGPTQTFALLPGSFALGAGQVETGATDQRGFARPAGAPADVGAFQSTPLVVNSAADADAPGLLTLRDAVNIASADATATAEPITFDPNVFAGPQTITLTGGALMLGGGQPSVAPITITGTSAGVAIDGGGLSTVFTVNGVTASLSDLTISDGVGGAGGGGVVNLGGSVTVADSTFLNDSSAFFGGGLYNNSGFMTVYDSTFAGDSAASGGGAYNAGGVLTILNSTLSGDSAGVSGGGVYNGAGGGGPGTLVLLGDILVGNTDGAGADDLAGFAVDPSSAFNLVGADGTASLTNGVNGNQVGVTVAEVALAPLGNYGGPTETFALPRGSLALGAGVTGMTQTYDQRGVPRPVGVPSDAGAFQAVFPPDNLQLSFSADVSEEGTPVTLSGVFDDARTNETDTVRIVWEDGSADTLLQAPAGTLAFGAAHTYTVEGDYFPVVFVTNADGQTTAAASEEQVLPSPFSDVVDLKGVPGQTVAGLSVDPVTGNVIETNFTVFPGDVGVEEFLAAQLNGVALPPTPGVVASLATYDFREHNLGPQDAVRVVLIIHGSLESDAFPVLLYLDTRTGRENLFRGDVLFAEAPNVLIVSILFDNADAPRLVDLTKTVFTVAAAVPVAAATAAVSPSVASSNPGATVAVQTASFQSTSQLRLTLATAQLSQVSQSAASLGENGGGTEVIPADASDDALAEIVARKLEALLEDAGADALFRLLAQPSGDAVPQAAPGMAPSPPSAPQGLRDDPPQPQAPEALSFGQLLLWRTVGADPAPIPGVGPTVPSERETRRAAPSAAYALTAPLIGLGLVPIRQTRKRRHKN